MFSKERSGCNTNVKEKVNALSEKDFTRLPVFTEREKIQKEEFKLPLLPTTTIGSFPQTSDVRQTRASYKKANISETDYEKFMKSKLRSVLSFRKTLVLMYLFTVNLKEMIW